MNELRPKRGEIWILNLNPVKGSEIAGERPCIVVQNDIGNAKALTTAVVPLTTKIRELHSPFQIVLKPNETGLPRTSVAKCEQIKTVSISHRLFRRVGNLSADALYRVEEGVLYEFGISVSEHALT